LKTITSIQNPLIKNLVQLQEKAKNRKQSGLFLIEGLREIQLAIKGGFSLSQILWVPEMMTSDFINEINKTVDTIIITREIYQKIAYRDSTEGIIAVAKTKTTTLSDLKLGKKPLILVAESPEKPGNLGALLRTADAAKLDAVLVADPKTDLYNPNTIRSSVGCLFTNQVVMDSSENIINFLESKNINIYATTLQNSNPYYEEIFTESSAIVVGTEASGLSQKWRDVAVKNIIIPMQGSIDSMNVSVAAAVVVFEAIRQRKIGK
jgi:RNA methyltransferase, TrmH family